MSTVIHLNTLTLNAALETGSSSKRKLKNKGELKAEKAEMLEKLLDLCGRSIRRVNQYV